MTAYFNLQILERDINAGEAAKALDTPKADIDRIGMRIGHSDLLHDVEADWRALEKLGIDSPGQSYDFVRVWVETFDIPRERQAYVSVELSGRPLMIVALEKTSRLGVTVCQPFAGSHVGVNAPLMDRERMAKLSDLDRRIMWERIRKALGADIVRFGRVLESDCALLPNAMAIASDNLYRTEFESWEDCDKCQRTRSRRKHDKQQGQKLAALGEVSYVEIGAEDDATQAIDVLFADRAARFAEQGIEDPFAPAAVRAFYRSVFRSTGVLKGQMQVLRLDDTIVAARYNLVAGSRMFCLISSMSTDPKLQPGSPGKQILVRLMQSIFASGFRSFDMGAGFTDEKRHWCNVSLPLMEVTMAQTLRGWLLMQMLSLSPRLKHAIKSNDKLFAKVKEWRAKRARRPVEG